MQNPLLCLSASAGSGKTYALVLRYLELLFLGAKPSSILTLTFTRKAAKEMQERIKQAICDIYTGEQKYFKELQSKGITENEILARIPQIYQDFLQEDLRITTLDAFFNQILRKFCWYVGVCHNFEIEKENFDTIIEIFLSKLPQKEKNKMIDWCFAKNQKLESFLWLCEQLDTIKEMLSPDFFLKQNDENSASYLEFYKQEALKYANALKETYITSKGEVSKALDFSSYEEMIQKGKTWLLKENLGDYRGFGGIPFNPEDFRQLKACIAQVFICEEHLFLKNLYTLFKVYLEAKAQYCKENNTLSFSGVSSKVFELLRQSNFEREFLYFRLDSSISHILIDEFQDTSVLQYEILRPLIEEIKSGLGSKNYLRSFFYVGDTKQSIYRFRGGNSELFDYVRRSFEKAMTKEDLKINYRSAQNIVLFINQTFKSFFPQYVPQIPNSSHSGYVRVQTCPEILVALKATLKDLCQVKQSQIAILTFDNKSVLTIAQSLENEGYRVVMDSNAKLIYHNEVRALIEFLKFLQTQNILYEEEFFSLLGRQKEANSSLTQYYKDFQKSPALGLIKVMKHYQIGTPSAKKFLEYAMNFQKIEDLLESVEDLELDVISSEMQGISVMTIHKSKGLEFDCVILLDALGGTQNKSDEILVNFQKNGIYIQNLYKNFNKASNQIRCVADRTFCEVLQKEEQLEQKDAINQLYVALTRAKKTLHILKKESKSNFDLIALDDCILGDLEETLKEESLNLGENLAPIEESSKPLIPQKMLQRLGTQQKMQSQEKIEEKTLGENLNAIYFGIALHFALEKKLTNHLSDNLLEAILRNKMGIYLNQETIRSVITQCNLSLKNPQFMEILSKGKVKCEIPFLSKGKQKRLDLLIEGEDKVFVIDYKSGLPDSSYYVQVKEYLDFVEHFYQKSAEGYIFYTKDKGRLIKI